MRIYAGLKQYRLSRYILRGLVIDGFIDGFSFDYSL